MDYIDCGWLRHVQHFSRLRRGHFRTGHVLKQNHGIHWYTGNHLNVLILAPVSLWYIYICILYIYMYIYLFIYIYVYIYIYRQKSMFLHPASFQLFHWMHPALASYNNWSRVPYCKPFHILQSHNHAFVSPTSGMITRVLRVLHPPKNKTIYRYLKLP